MENYEIPFSPIRLAKIQKLDHILCWKFWGNRQAHTLLVVV